MKKTKQPNQEYSMLHLCAKGGKLKVSFYLCIKKHKKMNWKETVVNYRGRTGRGKQEGADIGGGFNCCKKFKPYEIVTVLNFLSICIANIQLHKTDQRQNQDILFKVISTLYGRSLS